MIIEDEGGWVFEVPTQRFVSVPPPRPRRPRVAEDETPEAIDPITDTYALRLLHNETVTITLPIPRKKA